MNNQQSQQSSHQFIIPNFNRFGYLLYDRFYILLKHLKVLETNAPYTMFLNIYDRSSNGNPTNLVYAGIERQREFLNAQNDGLDDHWNLLKNIRLTSSETVESSRLIREFERGDLGTENIEIKSLSGYLNVENPTKEQTAEIPILRKHGFNEEDSYVSFPLIQFGKFEGVAHLIIKKEEVESKRSTVQQKKEEVGVKKGIDIRKEYFLLAIRIFTYEFEAILYDWDLSYENIFKASIINPEVLGSEAFYERVGKNPIMKELNYQNYFKQSYEYIKERINTNNIIPNYIKEEHRKRAIIAILIDSYAHNISAHSLTVLNWWFKQRAAQIRESDYFKNPDNIEELAKDTEIALEIINSIEDSRDNALSKYKAPLAPELQPLLKFLLEKGAFWSGVTRGITFGGEIQNLYKVLWEGFINNALYLGTIANSEQVNKINIHLTFFESGEKKGKRKHFNQKVIKKSNGINLDGLFAQINLDEPKLGKLEEVGQSAFVKLGKHFQLLKKELQGKEVFFPGGIIGMHSFFTLLENEIRNVKHFRGDTLKNIRKNGLTLNISIHERYVNPKANNDGKPKEIFKIGVWLKHPVELTSKLAVKRLNGLRKDIITSDTQQPKLGGSFQDKICAAMLFNNDFTKVQNGSEEEKERSTAKENLYYPWIKAASVTTKNITESFHEDFEVSARKYNNLSNSPEEFGKLYSADEGYLKKYFHLWKGDYIYNISRSQNWDWENVSRFNFVNIQKDDKEAFNLARKAGVIRIMENIPPDLSKADIYKTWLSKWFKEGDEAIRIILKREAVDVGHIIFDKFDGAQYFREKDYTDEIANQYDDYDTQEITFAHSSNIIDDSDSTFSIRSHGILSKKFFKDVISIEKFENSVIEDIPLYELLEVLNTKIAIFDNRIAGRVREEKIDHLNETLKCGIYREELETWNSVREHLGQYHFLIMHLSFIEGMLDEERNKYDEKGVPRFIENEIMPYAQVENDDFVLVITTGRGRTKWWEEIKKNSQINFATFRPIESLIEATEKASLKKDDIDLKYYLIKVLFGS